MKGGGKGFFTEETKYDKKKVWLDLLNEMTEHFPDPYKGELKGMAANIDAVVKDETEIELERPNWIWVENKEGKKERKKELKKENVKIPVEIANFMGKVYEDDKLNADAKYKDSVDILMKGIRSVHIRKDVAERTGITEKSRLDQRNSAMYVTAKLLGRPELLAKAVPLTIVRDGKEIQGTFMEKAEGVDINRIKPGDLDLDYDQDTFNHPKALKQIADLQVIDFICGNTDRHRGNMIYQFRTDENGKVILDQIKGIDNDSSFGFRYHYNTSQITSPEKMKVISEEMKNKLFSVDPKELKFALMPFGFSEKELGALEARYLRVQNEIIKGKIKVVKESEWKKQSLETLGEKGNLFGVIQGVQPSLMEKKETRKSAGTQQNKNTEQFEKPIEFAETGEGKSESVSEFQENHKKLMKLAKIMHKENHNLYINSGVFNEMKNKVYEMEKISTQLSNKYQNKGGVLETEDMNKLDRLYQELRKVSDSYIEAKKIAPESGHGQRRLALAKDLRDLAFDFCDFRNMEEMDAAKEEEIQISL